MIIIKLGISQIIANLIEILPFLRIQITVKNNMNPTIINGTTKLPNTFVPP